MRRIPPTGGPSCSELSPDALAELPEPLAGYHAGVASAAHTIPVECREAVAAFLNAATTNAAAGADALRKLA